MARRQLNPFVHRQVMQKDSFEIFHYINPNTCTCAPHQHDFFELFCLLEDSLDYVVEGLRYKLRGGSMILIGPGQIHRADVPGPVRDINRFVLWMRADYVRAILDDMPLLRDTLLGDMTGRNLIQPDGETGVLMRQLLFALHGEETRGEVDSEALTRSIIAQLLIYCGRCIARAQERVPPKAELRYREIMCVYEHIITHLNDELSVSGLAEMFFMDKNTLTRQFKRLVGMTPGECIRRHRLEAARQLIRRGAPMQQACAECGFSDYSAFYRAFRQAYGAAPSAMAGGRQ